MAFLSGCFHPQLIGLGQITAHWLSHLRGFLELENKWNPNKNQGGLPMHIVYMIRRKFPETLSSKPSVTMVCASLNILTNPGSRGSTA